MLLAWGFDLFNVLVWFFGLISFMVFMSKGEVTCDAVDFEAACEFHCLL